MLGHLVNRLLYVNDRAQNPAIAEEKIVQPVFIIGFPRTGTTILHDILAQDPANRVPLTWECMFPPRRRSAATFDDRSADRALRGSADAGRMPRDRPVSGRCTRWAPGCRRNA